jgi:glycosyltransferase involved in cell wall biosynthesis
MREKKSRVFVGPGNIAGNAASVAASLRTAGIYARSYSYYSHPFGYICDRENILIRNPFPDPKERNFIQKILVNKYSLSVSRTIQKVVLFIHALLKFNTFIFISNETFFSNNLDLRVLRSFRKKIAFLFVGCPERDPKDPINQSDGGFCSFCTDKGKQRFLNCYNNHKKKKIEYISKYAHNIFSHRDTISFVHDKTKIRPFYCISDSYISRIEIIEKFRSKGETFISHLPSNSLLKGTDKVVEAIDKCKSGGSLVRFFSNRVNHSEVAGILKQTHILIDQFSFGHGLLSVEAMSMGCVVICRTAKWFREDFPELPVVSCEPEDLAEVLTDLINDPDRMLDLALKSHEFYQRYHTPRVIGNYFTEILNLK